MINRRSFIALSSAGIATGITGYQTGFAQEGSSELPLQNASFIRDLAELTEASPEATPGATPTIELDLDDLRGYILGDPDAPNTLQLYSDYRCPYCRMFHTDIEPWIIEDFVTPGLINIELFDFTVIGVPSFEDLVDDTIESVQAAEATACAAEQGAYLAFRDWLFDGEPRTNDGDFSDDNLIGAAENLGLDTEQFATSLLDGVYESGVIAMVAHGIELGVRGTPTMILNNGNPFFVPENGYPGLKDLLESEIS